jgi:hypothetical protein
VLFSWLDCLHGTHKIRGPRFVEESERIVHAQVRDLFIDIHEKVLEPLHKADMTLEQVILIFQVLEKVLPNLSVLHHKSTRDKNSSLTSGGTPGSNSPIAGYPFPPWATAWRKCIEGVKMLTVTMYPALFGRVA